MICQFCNKDKKNGSEENPNCDFENNMDCIYDRCKHKKGKFTCFDCVDFLE